MEKGITNLSYMLSILLSTYAVPEIRDVTVQKLHHRSCLKLPFEGCIRFQWLSGWDGRKIGRYPIGYSHGLARDREIITNLLATIIGEEGVWDWMRSKSRVSVKTTLSRCSQLRNKRL